MQMHNKQPGNLRSAVVLLGALTVTCKEPDPMVTPPQTGPRLTVERVTTRANVAEQMRAAIEMQHSGEPLAETMGRDVAGYDRNALLPDQYTDPQTGSARLDIAGYSTAVESYEYSKLAMNTLSFESGAGLSLMYGPVLNPGGVSGAAALKLLVDRVQALAIASHAGVDSAKGPWVVVPAPTDNALNRLGFPGLWPQFAELSTYDQAIAPSGNAQRGCSLSGGYGASAGMMIPVGDYECGYNSLHINRDSAAKTLSVDALGLSAWKQALWVINYFQFVHDPSGATYTAVDAADLGQVGKVGNKVRAYNDDPLQRGPEGTFVGSNDLEGFQGLLMAEEVDNKAAFLLTKLTTTDGQALSGFPTTKAALDYDYKAPLRYFPHAVTVTETAGTADAEPQPTAFSITTAESRLPDLTALLGGYAEQFALTDPANAAVGGSSTVRPVFDGDPFAKDNGLPDGEATAHDRALAVLKVALVNLDRLHADPTTGVLLDSAQLTAGSVVRTPHATTTEVAYALIGLRTAYRSLTSQLTLYSNSTPDSVATGTALDATSLQNIPGGVTLAQRLQQLIKAQADFLATKLLDDAGLAKNGFNLQTQTADSSAVTVEAQAAAVRGLLEAYLATSNATYRSRAQAAYAVLEKRFYEPTLRIYRHQLGEDSSFVYTPGRFAVLQGALREMYTLVAARAGQETLRQELEERLGRLHKLILNGWDDRNQDGKVDPATECLRVEATVPRGGLQLAERALTGELGIEQGAPTVDRDRDCVPEIDDAKLPAGLAAELRLLRSN